MGLALNPLKNIVTAPCYKSLDFWYSISIYIYSPTLCKDIYIKSVYNALRLSTLCRLHNNTFSFEILRGKLARGWQKKKKKIHLGMRRRLNTVLRPHRLNDLCFPVLLAFTETSLYTVSSTLISQRLYH